MNSGKRTIVAGLAAAVVGGGWACWWFNRPAEPLTAVAPPPVCLNKTHAAPEVFSEIPLAAWHSSSGETAAVAVRQEPAFLTFLTEQIRGIAAMEESPERDAALKQLAGSISQERLLEAINELTKGSPPEIAHHLWLGLMRRWVDADPDAAATWAEALPPGPLRQEAVRNIAIQWANLDFAEAKNWVIQWPEGPEREGALIGIAYEAARSHPVEALNLAVTLPTEKVTDLLAHATSQWAAENPEAVVAWARTVRDEPLRQQLLARTAMAWADADPLAAATLASTELIAGRQQNDAVVAVVARWVQKDPLAVAEWVTSFGEGALRDVALQNMVNLWAAQDAPAAAQWLQQLSPGKMRDTALIAYVNQMAVASPNAAVRWAQLISDPALRYSTIKQTGG